MVNQIENAVAVEAAAIVIVNEVFFPLNAKCRQKLLAGE